MERFEESYKDYKKIQVAGNQALVTYSSTALVIMLLKSCNLKDLDHHIISRSLNFNEKSMNEEERTFNRTKEVIILHELTKKVNHQALPGLSTKALDTFLAYNMVQYPTGINDLKVLLADRKKVVIAQNTPKKGVPTMILKN